MKSTKIRSALPLRSTRKDWTEALTRPCVAAPERERIWDQAVATVICHRAAEHVGGRRITVREQELAIRLFTVHLYRWRRPSLGLLLLLCLFVARARGDEDRLHMQFETFIGFPEEADFEPPGGICPSLVLEGIAAKRARRKEEPVPSDGPGSSARSKPRTRHRPRPRVERRERRASREAHGADHSRSMRNWQEVFGVPLFRSEEELQRLYRTLAKKVAPRGLGDSEHEIKELNVARDEALLELRARQAVWTMRRASCAV